MSLLYKLTFPDGKSYIGVTKLSIEKRCRGHLSKARDGCNRAISRAIRKYGPKSFVAQTLVVGSFPYVLSLEAAAIERFGTLTPGGYNISTGGDNPYFPHLSGKAHPHFGKKFSAEYRAKLSEAAKRREKRKSTERSRALVSASLMGHPVPTQVREKISLALKGRTLSDEHKRNISLGGIGRKKGIRRNRSGVAIFCADMGINKGKRAEWTDEQRMLVQK